MQITDSDFTRPKDEYSSYFGRPYDVLVVSDDQTTVNMDPCDRRVSVNVLLVSLTNEQKFQATPAEQDLGTFRGSDRLPCLFHIGNLHHV